jgi:hypothetical protein
MVLQQIVAKTMLKQFNGVYAKRGSCTRATRSTDQAHAAQQQKFRPHLHAALQIATLTTGKTTRRARASRISKIKETCELTTCKYARLRVFVRTRRFCLSLVRAKLMLIARAAGTAPSAPAADRAPLGTCPGGGHFVYLMQLGQTN